MKIKFFVAALILTSSTFALANPYDAYNGTVVVPQLSTSRMANADGDANALFRDFLTKAPTDVDALRGKRIAIISTDGAEEIELTAPLKWLRDRGAKVDVVAPRFVPLPPQFGVLYPEQRATHILTVRFFENASWIKIDRFLDEVKSSEYDAVLIPGGAWNPDNLRVNGEALALIKEVNAAGKPIATICHGPLVLVNAGLVAGKKLTGYWNIHLDLSNAGGIVLDQSVVVDGNLITSRFPYDLPNMVNALADALIGAGK